MRKSTIKFGSSFGTSFHKPKEEMEKHVEVKEKRRSSNKKNKFEEDHDISKKFDEMEEILLELKMREEK